MSQSFSLTMISKALGRIYICSPPLLAVMQVRSPEYLTAISTENDFRALPVVFFLVVGGSFLTALRR